MKKCLWLTFVFVLWNPLIAQTPAAPLEESLSPAKVKAALAGNGSKHWITLTDNRLMLAAALLGRGELAQEPSVTILMPDAIIAMRGTFARKQYLPYEPDTEDRRRSLTIVAEGIAIGSPSGPACSSIARVVLLSDRSGGTTAEAYTSESTDESWQNGFGASSQCQSLRARFSLATMLHMFTLPKDAGGAIHYLGIKSSGSIDPEKQWVFLRAKGALYLDDQPQKFWDRFWSFVLGFSAGLLAAIATAWVKGQLRLP